MQLRHDVTAVDLRRLLRRPELRGNLLVRSTGDQTHGDLALPCRQQLHPREEGVTHLPFAVGSHTFLQSASHGGDELFGFDRLHQKIDCAVTHRLHDGGHVTAVGDEHDRKRRIVAELSLQIGAGQAGQMLIDHDTCRPSYGEPFEKRLGRAEPSHRETRLR